MRRRRVSPILFRPSPTEEYKPGPHNYVYEQQSPPTYSAQVWNADAELISSRDAALRARGGLQRGVSGSKSASTYRH